jgi:hypothetical protein
MSVLNKNISYYPSIIATNKGIEVNLLRLLQSNKHKVLIERLRKEPNASIQKAIKETLPCFTVAGIFTRRNTEGLANSSGLAAIDLDSAEDYDVIHLLNELKKIDCIAYAGLSCRGNRLFCIVPFWNPDKYVKQYERLIKSFEDMGLPMGDSCHKTISQPRFVSWNDDNTQFFNHHAKQYSLLPAEKTVHLINKTKNNNHDRAIPPPDNAFQWCVAQINKNHSFTQERTRHKYIIALARYCNMKGVPESETMQGCFGYSQPDFTETEITKIVKYIYIKHIDSHNKLPFK